MADIHGSPGGAQQMPASDSGPAPVPYTGPDQSPEPMTYAAAAVSFQLPGVEVMGGVSGNKVQESGYAHDVNAGLVSAYYPGATSPIQVHGDPDAGGRDVVSDTPAGAVEARQAFYLEYEGDTHPAGSVIGDLVNFPPSGEDPGAGVGNTMPTGGFYDPGRDYGGEQGAPGYQGEAQ